MKDKCDDCNHYKLIEAIIGDDTSPPQMLINKIEEIDDIYNSFVYEMDLQIHELKGLVEDLTKESNNEGN